MKYKIAYSFFVIRNYAIQPILSFAAKYKCFIWGVCLGRKIRFLGVPRIRNLGSIDIGSGTRIISDSRNVVGSEIKTTFETGVKGEIIIGENCGISNSCFVSQSRILIGNRVYIGGGVRIYDNDFHSIKVSERLNNPELIPTSPVVVGNQVFIGGHSIILKGVTIGDNAVIGAGSIVTRNVGSDEVWAGVPAKKIGSV